jgi:hypothetical protein
MLEPWIIEQIRRREEERRRNEERPRLELPVPEAWPARNDAEDEEEEDRDEPKRGVVIIGI